MNEGRKEMQKYAQLICTDSVTNLSMFFIHVSVILLFLSPKKNCNLPTATKDFRDWYELC